MNLVIDAGNTRIKAGLFNNNSLQQSHSFEAPEALKAFISGYQIENAIISSVRSDIEEIASLIETSHKKIILNSTTRVPIHVNYKTPKTLGVDRLAAVCGAYQLFPNRNCLVIDAGTCINYEFIDQQGVYQGGSISPGISMRFEAMHTFTARLPLVKAKLQAELTGDSTEACMLSGVMNGTIAEVEGIQQKYEKLYPQLITILCGGDYLFFENKVKPAIFVTPELVLIGLNSILSYHATH